MRLPRSRFVQQKISDISTEMVDGDANDLGDERSSHHGAARQVANPSGIRLRLNLSRR